MYIGPWQEFKLAKLLQAQQGPPQSHRTLRTPSGLTPQSAIDKTRGGSLQEFDTASVSSSTRSGFSTKSAPPRTSAQSRLDSMYRDHERGGLGASSSASASALSTPAGARPPRPRSSAGAGARRPGACAQGRGRGPARRAVPKPSSEEASKAERRARIAQMQRLYGLGGDGGEAPTPAAQEPASPALSSLSSIASTEQPPPGIPEGGRKTYTRHEGSVAHARTPSIPEAAPLGVAAAPFSTQGLDCEETVDVNGGADTADLIAWSRMLRPAELSPEATLASFFQPE